MCHEVYQKSLSQRLAKWEKRQSRRLDPQWRAAALLLLRLDLDPLKSALETLYAPSPRGRTPFDPIIMLRSLLLMMALGQHKITTFAADLRQKPRLAQIAGFDPKRTPAVGTFYLFIDRIEDGPPAPFCPHRVRPSLLRKKPLLRNLSQEKAVGILEVQMGESLEGSEQCLLHGVFRILDVPAYLQPEGEHSLLDQGEKVFKSSRLPGLYLVQ